MTTIEIAGSDLLVHVQGMDRFWALKSELRAPLAHVAGIERAGQEAHEWFHGIRMPGTNLPGVITAGTFYEHQGRVFWDIHDPDKAVAIRLHDEKYVKLIVEVADPDATIAAVRAALPSAGGG